MRFSQLRVITQHINDCLHIPKLFYVGECFHWSDSWDLGCVIAAAEDAEVDELIESEAKFF